MFPLFKRALMATACAASLTACFGDLAIDKVELEPFETTLALPLFKSKVTINDLVSSLDTSFINTDSEGLIYFYYQDTLISYKVGDLIAVPSISKTHSTSLPLPTIPSVSFSKNIAVSDFINTSQIPDGSSPIPPFKINNNLSYSLSTLSGFEQMTLNAGSISIGVTNGFKANLAFSLSLQTQAGAAVGSSVSFDIPSGGKQTKSINLAGATITKNMKFVLVGLSSNGSSGAVNYADKLSFEGLLSGVDVRSISLVLQEPYVSQGSVDLSMPLSDANIQAYNVRFVSGTGSYSISSSLTNLNMSAELSYPSSKNSSNKPVSAQINVSNGNGTGNFSVANSSFDLTTRTPAYNTVPVNYKITVPASTTPVTFQKSNTISVNFNMSDLKFLDFSGYLGNNSVNLGSDTLNISLFQNTLKSSKLNLSLVNPKLNFKVANQHGVPAQFRFVNTMVKNPGENALNIAFSQNPVQIPAGSIASPSITTFGVTNLNSLFSYKPQVIYYGASAQLNPSGKATNYIHRDQGMVITVDAEIPLHGKLSNLFLYSDTIDVDMSLDDKLEDIQSASFKAVFTNGIPLEFEPQIYMFNEAGVVIDSLFAGNDNNLFQSAQIDANGKVTQPVVSEITTAMNQARLDNFLKVKKMSLAIRMVTAQNGATNVRILDSYTLQAALGAIVKVRVKK